MVRLCTQWMLAARIYTSLPCLGFRQRAAPPLAIARELVNGPFKCLVLIYGPFKCLLLISCPFVHGPFKCLVLTSGPFAQWALAARIYTSLPYLGFRKWPIYLSGTNLRSI